MKKVLAFLAWAFLCAPVFAQVQPPQTVTIVPTASASAAMLPVSSSVAEGSHVLKASGGNLYDIQVVTGATAGYLMLFDAPAAPSDGAVSPVKCFGSIAINSAFSISWGSGPPPTFANGIVAVFSSTGCFSKTVSATAYFSAEVK